MMSRGRNIERLDEIIEDMAHARPLSPLRRDHPLSGEWEGFRECHIEGDWLLIYRIDSIPEKERKPSGSVERLMLVRTGTHADLFE